MPVPFPSELGGPAGEPENDFFQLGIFTLPDLKTVLEELPEISVGGPGPGKWRAGDESVSHPGQDKNAPGLAILVVAQQIPLSGNTREMSRLNQPFLMRFCVKLLVLKLHEALFLDRRC